MRARIPIDHPAIKWFLLFVASLSIVFGIAQYQGNRMQERWIEADEAWLEQDEQWNADITAHHEEILELVTERCGGD